MKHQDDWTVRAGKIGAEAFSVLSDLVEALDTDDDEEREDAAQAIREDPLSLEVHSDWRRPSDHDSTPAEYRILLATGGPAVRIIGTLDRWCEPDSAVLQVQHWFQPWTDVEVDDDNVLLSYARHFYYGE